MSDETAGSGQSGGDVEYAESPDSDPAVARDGGKPSEARRGSSELRSDGGERSDGSRASSDLWSDGGEAYDVDEADPYGPGGGAAIDAPGAPDDQEMPLGEHIEEMVRRLGVVVVVMAIVAGIVFPLGDRLINFLWYSFLPGTVEMCPPPEDVAAANYEAACPWVYHPLALMFARIKVASLVGFIIAMPVMVYESYLFMKPGLYPRERRYYLASVPTSLVLAAVGVGFAYLIVLPALFVYFTGYTAEAAGVAFGLTETFNLIVMMMGFFALIFQIPLLIMLAVMMGVTTRQWMADKRLYFYGGFATIAFLFSPDPTGMAPILVAVTMIVLFEGTLLILRWTRESSPIPSSEELEDLRPVVWLLAVLAGYVASSAPLPDGYYDQLPAAVTGGLASLGMTQSTPLVIGLALIAVYELVNYVLRRTGANPHARRILGRGRALVWPVSLVIGYFGSPDPTLVARADALALPPAQVAVVGGGLIALFELAVVVRDWRESEA